MTFVMKCVLRGAKQLVAISDESLLKWINEKYGRGKYEFRYINAYLIGSFLRGTNKLCETHYKYAFFRLYQAEMERKAKHALR